MGKIAYKWLIVDSYIDTNKGVNTVIKEKRINLFGSKNLGVTVSKPSVLGAKLAEKRLYIAYYHLDTVFPNPCITHIYRSRPDL